MSELIQEIYEEFTCDVSEMEGPDSVTTLLRLDPAIIDRIKRRDPDPKFATFVIKSGQSKSKRNWGPHIFQKAVDAVNASANGDPVVGYLGHIKPEDEGFSFPPIQLHWLKARLDVSSNEDCRGIFKAYVLPSSIPGAVGRDYIDGGLVNTISWQGKAAMRPVKGGGHDVVDFDLESIDLSRPRKAGMSARLVGALTGEMDGNDNGGNSVDGKEIAALQENEVRAHAPDLVKRIEDAATSPLSTRIGEMETAIETHKPISDLVDSIRKALGLDEKGDVLEALGGLIAKSKEVGKGARTKFLDDVLGRKFKDDNVRGLVRRLVVSEMEKEENGTWVTEMDTCDSDDALKMKTDEIVTRIIDGDTEIKALVSEMEGSGGRSFQQNEGGRNNGQREIKAGFENDSIRVGKAGNRR